MNEELLKKAKQANSPEELLAIAKDNGYSLNEGEAKEYFDRLNKSGELSDDELDNVSGGCGGSPKPDGRPVVDGNYSCPYFVCKMCGKAIEGDRSIGFHRSHMCEKVYCLTNCFNCKSFIYNYTQEGKCDEPRNRQ